MAQFHIPPAWKISDPATPELTFLNRRQVLQGLGLGTVALALPRVARGR